MPMTAYLVEKRLINELRVVMVSFQFFFFQSFDCGAGSLG